MPAAFGRFRVLRQLGSGTLGPVFRAEDQRDGQSVVVKVLRLEVSAARGREILEGLQAL